MRFKRKKILILSLILLIVLLPLWMWLAWLFTPKKKLVIAIVDKTEITKKGQEHVSLTWILNHERYTKTPDKSYQVSSDYFGFFPKEKEKFRLKGLERFNEQQLGQLSDDCNAVYLTDTYGVYNNEWFSGKASTERSGILYGGMSKEDISFLQKMKGQKKLVIAEFNSIGSPTQPAIREQFQNLFGLSWSGWIGRYFESLDTNVNKELPHWLIQNYLRQHNNQWPFKKQGIALVSDKDEVEILEEGTHLGKALPVINTSKTGQQQYGLPATIEYSFWFDIMRIDTSINHAVADFAMDVNAAGKELLSKHQLSPVFPAVISHTGSDYSFYYFCADFCDNPVSFSTSYFKGISLFSSFFYKNDPAQRGGFFWNYYRPLMTNILKENYTISKN